MNEKVEEQDRKEFREWWRNNGSRLESQRTEYGCAEESWLASRRLLKEKQVRRDSNEPSDSYDD